MNAEKRTGIALTGLGALLLVVQFVIAFSLPLEWRTGGKEGVWWLLLHLSPLAILFSGAYILFRKRTPGADIVWVRALLTLLASWGLAGAALLIVLLFMLFVRGTQAVEPIFPYLAAGLIILIAAFYPLIYRRLR